MTAKLEESHLKVITGIVVACLLVATVSGCVPSQSSTSSTVSQSADETSSVLATSSASISVGQAYTYTLLADRVTCGFNLCSDSGIVSVQVIVTGNFVMANICGSQMPVDPQTCAPTVSVPEGQDQPEWWQFQGIRDGDKAMVTAATHATDFTWGIVTFAGTAQDSPAVMFTSADNCQRLDGSFGQENDLACV